MSKWATIVVAGGSSKRFGSDKTTFEVDRRPLIAHTLEPLLEVVDQCVLVCRPDQIDYLESLELGVEIRPGGTTRTASERAGLAVIDDKVELIGIHDGARPFVTADLVQRLFQTAEKTGGAVPVLAPDVPLIYRDTGAVAHNLFIAQTPQVFGATALRAAYARAANEGFDAHDTFEVINAYSDLRVAAIPGDPRNIKVTYPDDLPHRFP